MNLFTECTQAILFWKEFLDWSSRVVNSRLLLSKNEIMFGIIKATSDKLLMNKFIRQNFGGGLTLKTLYLERSGVDSVET